ncbi:MAG: nucleotide sugar dehydrogenase [Chlamydiae bacterium]|nr:nucleotide sugar dehydrogenase [Chlamydiota bacterium]
MSFSIEKKILNKTARLCVIGLGYVGLSITEAFTKAGFSILGLDTNKEKINHLKEKIFVQGLYLPHICQNIDLGKIVFTDEKSLIKDVDIFIIAVSTPVDIHEQPDLQYIINAAETIASSLKPGQLVISQSTSFPGTTETKILPILEKSGLKVGKDFYLSFVPEISDFGNPQFKFEELPKIIGGVTSQCAKITQTLYANVSNETLLVSSPKVAEAAKLLQNTYRLINISFVNEMKMMFDKMEIDIWEVIGAAATKPFGFAPFYPGPGIGGECIPVGPHSLVWKAKETQGPTGMIEKAYEINHQVTEFVIHKVLNILFERNNPCFEGRVMLLGISFKKDLADIRESCSIKIFKELVKYKIHVDYNDPYVPKISLQEKDKTVSVSSTEINPEILSSYDCVVILTDHSCYNWDLIAKWSLKIVDTRNALANFPQYQQKITKA